MPPHPIYLAAERGDLAEVQRLITENPALLGLRGSDGHTPLLRAARHGQAAMVEWLLGQGADPEAQVNGRGNALYLASSWGHTAVISVLLDRGFDIIRGASVGLASLMMAAFGGHVAAVELLLSRKEIQIDGQSGTGSTALYWASFENHPEVIGLLLKAGADPRIALNDGRTPLDQARHGRSDECIPLLEVSK